MPAYKLTYFNVKGRAESARYIFHLAGKEFEDCRVSRDEWKEMKSKSLLGQLPILEVDGKELPQSSAICRYLADEFGFLGSSSWERAEIDVVCETVRDLTPEIAKLFNEQDAAKKAEMKEKFLTEVVYHHTGNLEKLLKRNNGGNGWFVGDKVSLADVGVFAMIFDFLPFIAGKSEGDIDLKDQKLLKAFMERFKSLPEISDWISKRPQSSL